MSHPQENRGHGFSLLLPSESLPGQHANRAGTTHPAPPAPRGALAGWWTRLVAVCLPNGRG